jgi:transcriptional regulator with XRE-family HTH domain
MAIDRYVSRALGEELRRRREALGWSRARLVACLPSGIKDRTLMSYEDGTRNLTVVRLLEVCQGLGVPAPLLLNRALHNTHARRP